MLDFGFYNMDCLEGMKEFPDDYFDLAIVDPPYGDGGGYWKSSDGTRFGGRFDKYRGRVFTGNTIQGATPAEVGPNVGGGVRHYAFGARKKQSTYQNRRNMGREIRKKIIAWDIAPGEEYFNELFRISRNQVIWGGKLFPITADALFPGMA